VTISLSAGRRVEIDSYGHEGSPSGEWTKKSPQPFRATGIELGEIGMNLG
jgi:hypothetical protein